MKYLLSSTWKGRSDGQSTGIGMNLTTQERFQEAIERLKENKKREDWSLRECENEFIRKGKEGIEGMEF